MEVATQAFKIPMEEIFSDDEFNCRGKIAPIDVVELAKSIEKFGLQSPIVVQPYSDPNLPKVKYRIVSGHRRHAAHRINKAKTIDAIIKEGLDELKARQLNLEENLKRKDLNILQEAKAIKHFRDASWQEELIAHELGVSRGWVQIRLMLLSFPEDIQMVAAAGLLTQENIKYLYSIKDLNKRYEAVRAIKDAKLSGQKKLELKVENKKKKNPLAKKPRNREEIFEIIELIIDVIGDGCFATRCLSWAAGEISDFELHREFQEFCDHKGIRYIIPSRISDAMQSVS